jgi:hypothetical protein
MRVKENVSVNRSLVVVVVVSLPEMFKLSKEAK